MESKREAHIERKTTETDINLSLNIDGRGDYEIATGIGFLDHMLSLFTRHGFFDLKASCRGDLNVGFHHSVEDLGICLGEAIGEALGARQGVRRFGTSHVPMDESLARVVIDLSGRPFLVLRGVAPGKRAGDFGSELVEDFFQGLVDHARINLHIELLSGGKEHHDLEAIFKAFGRALDEATSYDERVEGVLSTKGRL